MTDYLWLTLFLGAALCIGYLGIQLYISRRVIETLQETAIIVTPAGGKKNKAGRWLLQMVGAAAIVVAAFSLVLG